MFIRPHHTRFTLWAQIGDLDGELYDSGNWVLNYAWLHRLTFMRVDQCF